MRVPFSFALRTLTALTNYSTNVFDRISGARGIERVVRRTPRTFVYVAEYCTPRVKVE